MSNSDKEFEEKLIAFGIIPFAGKVSVESLELFFNDQIQTLEAKVRELEKEVDKRIKNYIKLDGKYGEALLDVVRVKEPLQKENAKLRECVESISKNTCCENCQEARFVALKTLKELERGENE